jgi:hypothetical protein
MLNSMKARVGRVAGLASIFALTVTAAANAAAYDIAPVTDGVTSQITASLPIILPVVGGLVALGLVLKMARRWFKA